MNWNGLKNDLFIKMIILLRMRTASREWSGRRVSVLCPQTWRGGGRSRGPTVTGGIDHIVTRDVLNHNFGWIYLLNVVLWLGNILCQNQAKKLIDDPDLFIFTDRLLTFKIFSISTILYPSQPVRMRICSIRGVRDLSVTRQTGSSAAPSPAGWSRRRISSTKPSRGGQEESPVHPHQLHHRQGSPSQYWWCNPFSGRSLL